MIWAAVSQMGRRRRIEPMLNCFYVYVAFRPWDGSPCYVGKGKGRRWQKFSPADRRNNRHLLRIVAKARRLGLDFPVIKVRENLTEDEAFQTERAFIAAIGRGKNGPLVNLTDGGDGPVGQKMSAKARKLIGKKSKEMWSQNRERIIAAQNEGRASPEYRAQRSAISKRVASDPARRAEQSKTILEKFSDPEFCARHSLATKKAMARDDVKENVSNGQKLRFQNPEELIKASRRRKGSKQSPETCAKIAAKHTGQKRSAEARANMTLGQLRRAPPTPETRAKMSASAKARQTKTDMQEGI